MKQPSYFRAREALLKEIIASEIEAKGGDDKKSKLIPILRSGKFPESLKQLENKIDDRQKDFSNEPLTELEIFSFNTYFTMFPELVAGVESDGSGFLNPIEIEGDYSKVDKVTDIPLPNLDALHQAPTEVSSAHQTVDIPDEPVSTSVDAWYAFMEYRTIAGKYQQITNMSFLDGLQLAYKWQTISVEGKFLSYLFHKVSPQELTQYESMVIPDYVYDSLDLPIREQYFGPLTKVTSSDALAVGDKVLYHGTETKVTEKYHDKRKVFVHYEYNKRHLVEVASIELMPKALVISHSSKRSVEDLPNIVVRRANTIDGTLLAYVYGTHSGTIASIEDLAEQVTEYMYKHFPDAVAHRSGYLVTDVEGIPAYRIAPNKKVVPLQAKEPIYNEISQPVTDQTLKIPSGYKFNFSGLGMATKKDKTFPAIETELLAELSKLGADNLWNKPRHANNLIYNQSGHRIELFFEDVVKMNVTTSLTYAGEITFNNKKVENLAADIDALAKLHWVHRVPERDRKPQYEPDFYYAEEPATQLVVVGAGTVGNTEVSATSMAMMAQSITDKKKKDQKQEKLPDTLSFDEVVKLYNPGITADEIKAWIWYKRQFGHPMKGWNKYYISNNKSGKKTQVVTANVALELLDNRWQPVRTVAPGTSIGKKHSKEHNYRGITYWIVKNDQQEILFVDSSKVVIKDLSYFTEESEIMKLVKSRALVYIDGEYLPIPIYTFGNMYERERELEREKEFIIKEFGKDYFDWVKELIKDNKPNELRIESKDKSQRPKILCVSKFALDITQFGIKELADDTGIVLPKIKRRGLSEDDPENQYSLQEGFIAWLDTKTDNDVVGSNKTNILNYYLGNKRFPEDTSEEQQSEIRANARIACEELFSEFLASGLLYNDQQKVNRIWNETFNAYGSVNKYKVPVGFTCSRTFKNSLLSIRPVQREGIAFMGIVGAGCLAYDVGVGKTMSAIITLAQAIQTGTCSRPVVVVPKPTYHKWKRELFGFWTDGAKKADKQFKNSTFVTGLLSGTDIKLNDWQNLSTKIVEKLGDELEKKIPENTITLLTYEGLSQIGFSSSVYDSIFASLVDILNNGGAEKSARDKAIDYSKYELMMGKGLKKTVADIDVLGLDYIVVDEAHNFKNVFDAVGKDKDDKRRMLFGLKGAQSERAIKLFFQTNYIQRTYGTNVMLLTATPFTNSPLEIFSMFSFIGYESLRKYNLQNIRRFFETFVLESVEYTVNLREEIVSKPVIKAFNNKQVLQKLLYNHFDYKTGEDAGVVRPCKVNLPMLKEFRNGQTVDLAPDKQITTYLNMTAHQINNQKGVVEEASKNPFESPGAMFRAMAKSLDNALSPHIYESKIPQSDLTAEAFVNESPKIGYVVECIKSVKEYHEARKEPLSGQVIYSNRGKEYFPLLKQYLEDYIGYKKRVEFGDVRLDEVEIIESGLAETKKDNIKEGFLSGVVKVIIGTATIKEGVDLQNVGTVLYNLYPDWNPTDLKQLEGRIHRQGNQFGYVRIVMPLVVNSMDVFVFQKLEEKTARINSIWFKADKGNTLEMDSIDVEEIKYALIDNPRELARMKFEKQMAQAQKEKTLSEENQKMYGELKSLIHYYNQYRGRLIADLEAKLTKFKYAATTGKENALAKYTGELDSEQKAKKKKLEEIIEKIERIVERIEKFLLSVPQDDKDLLDIIRTINQSNWGEGVYMQFDTWTTNQFRENFSQVKKAEKQILFARNLTIHDDLSGVKAQLDADVKSKTDFIEHLTSDQYWEQLLQSVYSEMEKRSQVRGEMHEQITKFRQLNILLSYKSDNVDKDVCALPDTECCGFNPDSQVIHQLEYRNQIVEVETEQGIEELPVVEQEPLTIEVELEEVEVTVDTQTQLAEAIEALQVMLEMSEELDEIDKLKEAIETLEILVEMEVAA